VGIQRAPLEASQVKLYLRPPANYEEIALVSADSRNSFGTSEQAKMDVAIGSLKKEAAKLGANGILLSAAGDRYAGSFGSVSGFSGNIGGAFGIGSPVTPLWSGISYSTPVFIKTTEGVAVYVPEK
jgi:hypothetical protein